MAQSICPNTATDAFEVARRSRRALEDIEQVNNAFQSDLSLLTRASQMHGVTPTRLRLYAGPMVQIRHFPGLSACTTQGARPADLFNTRLGLFAGIDELKWGLSFRFIYSDYDSSLETTLGDPVKQHRANTFNANTGQETMAYRLQLTRWFAVTWGKLQYENISVGKAANDVTYVGLKETNDATQNTFIRAEVPAADLSFDFIFGDKNNNVEVLYIDLKQLYLPTKHPLAVSLKAGYLRDENQYYGVIGLDWFNLIPSSTKMYSYRDTGSEQFRNSISITDAIHHIGIDVAPEFNTLNLRFARARMQLNLNSFTKNLNVYDNIIGGQPYLTFNLKGEVSVYHGRLLQEKTNTNWAVGTTGTFSAGLGLKFASLYLDGSFGFNRPETLSRMVQAVNTPEVGIQMRWRVGF